jgi:hypothetical protein
MNSRGSSSAEATARNPHAAANADLGNSTSVQTPSGATSADSTVNGNASMRARGASSSAPVAGGISTALASGAASQNIHSVTHSNRDQVLTELDSRLDASEQAVGELRRNSRNLSSDARRQFDAAYDDVRAKEQALKASIRNARQATSDSWTQAQSQLSSDYDAYVQALAHAETAASTPPAP